MYFSHNTWESRDIFEYDESHFGYQIVIVIKEISSRSKKLSQSELDSQHFGKNYFKIKDDFNHISRHSLPKNLRFHNKYNRFRLVFFVKNCLLTKWSWYNSLFCILNVLTIANPHICNFTVIKIVLDNKVQSRCVFLLFSFLNIYFIQIFRCKISKNVLYFKMTFIMSARILQINSDIWMCDV